MVDVLVVGGGGREHALGWALRKSPEIGKLFFAPGNGGTAFIPYSENLAVKAEDLEGLERAIIQIKPGLVVVGPEVPLVEGLADRLRGNEIPVFGPGAAGAQLEASKAWAKGFMARYGIPAAKEQIFNNFQQAHNYLDRLEGPFVIKADGLAGGKGVLVTSHRDEARRFIFQLMQERIFGQSGASLIIEEFLQGVEVSVLAVCDTVSGVIIPLEPASDYKRAFDKDEGPNTGGMGAYSPPSIMTPRLRRQVTREILDPTLRGLITEGIDYRGIIYAGVIVTPEGPKLLEYNCRFGDPETQSLLPRLKSNLFTILKATADGKLASLPPFEWDPRPSVGVVLAASGYPGSYKKGLPVTGAEEFGKATPDIFLFHAGTAVGPQNNLITSGGRIFNVVGLDNSIPSARKRLYNILEENRLQFEGMHYRKDIAAREEKEAH